MEPVATVRVVYGDTDAAGIVYYANYLRWFEVGRAELMRRRGMAYAALVDEGFHLPVTRAEVRYHVPARYDEEVAILAAVQEVGRASLTFAYRIERKADGVLLVEGSTTHAFVDRDWRVARVPKEFIERTGLAPASGN